jgi:hypothetical protein
MFGANELQLEHSLSLFRSDAQLTMPPIAG